MMCFEQKLRSLPKLTITNKRETDPVMVIMNKATAHL